MKRKWGTEMLEYEIEIGKEGCAVGNNFAIGCIPEEKKSGNDYFCDYVHNLSAVRNVKLYAWQGRNGFTFYDSLGNFSIFCMRREKGTAESTT